MQIDIMEHIKYTPLIVIVKLFNLCFTKVNVSSTFGQSIKFPL